MSAAPTGNDPLDLTALADAARSYRIAYLITQVPPPVEGSGGPHAVPVSATVQARGIRIVGAGRASRAHVGACPAATVLWAPSEPDGYSLIVDADAELDGDAVLGVPRRAVLHRALVGPAPERGCGADCVEVPIRPGR